MANSLFQDKNGSAKIKLFELPMLADPAKGLFGVKANMSGVLGIPPVSKICRPGMKLRESSEQATGLKVLKNLL
jgi:hypothetical protein